MSSDAEAATPPRSDLDELTGVFFPHFQRQVAEVRSRGDRFAYYTTAEVAFKLLRFREVWLRNALLMNDFSEVSHGLNCLRTALDGDGGAILKGALGTAFPGLPEETEDWFYKLRPIIEADTFITCFSEHLVEEDRRGRLSMWRAYGGTNGVAVVINGEVMHSPSNALAAYSSPVFYGTEAAFSTQFSKVAQGIADAIPLLERVGRAAVSSLVFHMFRFGALCTKHPGFQEELEWRVIACPSMETSSRLLSSIEVVRGVPQKVLKIKLENAAEQGLVGLELPELLDRIIIGPCEFPDITGMAFMELLAELGIPNPEKRVVISDIPLRHG